MSGELVFLDELVDGLRWDIRYATSDNFTGAPVDGYLADRLVGTPAMAAALADVHDRAAGLGFGLLVWDAYRPQRAVDAFVRWAEQPEDEPTRQRWHPRLSRSQVLAQGWVAERSAHSRGAAVDLTLVDLATGVPVDMGGRFDLMDVLSQHGALGIGGQAARHRMLLRRLMEASGFVAYELEWWHYSLRDEPHPETYFDVPITASGLADQRSLVPTSG